MSAIAQGIIKGIDAGLREYGQNERRARAIERDDKRFEWETAEQDEKARLRQAGKDFATQMQEARQQFATGKLPGQEQNVLEQADPAAPRQAIAADGTQPAPAAADASSRAANIFKSNGEGLYKDQKLANDAYWSRLRDITAGYYEKTGQVDKLMEIDKKINEWKNSSYDELRKAAAAAVATGDSEALKMVSRVGQLTGLGVQMDGSTASFDPKTQTWKGVKVMGADGKEAVRDVSAVSLLSALSQLSPEKLIEFNIGRADKDRQFGLDERKTRADERRADAYASTARDNAETNRNTRETNNLIRERQQQLKEDEGAAKLFGGAFGVKEIEVKTKDEVEAMLPAQRQAYEKQRTEQAQRRELASYAQGVYALNERKVPPAQITQLMPVLRRRISEGKGADGVDEATGLPFVNFNGKKILLPKD